MTQGNHKKALQEPIFNILTAAADELAIDCYVIGGFVRDYLLQKSIPKDIDVVAVGSGIALARKVASLLPGNPKISIFKNFGTAMIKYKDLELEFVGARKESYHHDSRKPVVEDGTLKEDQERRDFTINALALSLNKEGFGDLLDPFDGINDLEKKIIRTPLEPG
ncbi:MAG: tRNA nucleotidyltransferase, partial [Maribacter sp.]